MAYRVLAGNCAAVACRECHQVLLQENGIWLALTQNREEHFARFMREYETVRKLEGRGSTDPQFYLSLPYADRTGRNSWQWAIRARTHKYVERRILPAIRTNVSPLNILDLGAGNGWLSYRLARIGHHPIAVDLLTNDFDGLGAAMHYQRVLPSMFPRFQAELDRLPFASWQFDCVIFNASFHYSEDYDHTLAEAIRCVRPGGTIVIADSPSYTRDESGQQMLAERRKLFQQKFGFTSDALDSREYLTKDILLGLEARHNVEWTKHDVWYGFRWALRPLLAHIKRRREPAQFRIYTAQVSR
jgi:ubiquinone/menaquinone biosynthesis C-methylase UbiE